MKKTAGRPRLLTLERIIETAADLDTNDFSMTAVAEKLDVSTATLYSYIGSREELLRRATLRRMRRPNLADTGQHWSNIVHAVILDRVEALVDNPQAIFQYLDAILGPEEGVGRMEHVLALLVRRNFRLEEALKAYRNASYLALGLAVAQLHRQRGHKRGAPHSAGVQRVLTELPVSELPLVHQAGAMLADEDQHFSVDAAARQLIAGIAAERGEQIPDI